MLTNKTEIRFFSVLGLILFIFLTITYVIGHREIERDKQVPVAVKNPFENISLTAKAAYVLDSKTGKVLFAKNADERLPLASLTKVMTALVASDIADPESTVTITRSAVATSGDSGLRVGERWVLRDLLDFFLVSSANDGARAVALSLGALSSPESVEEIENDFIQRMNARANEIGLKNTYFFNVTGLDETLSKGGAYGSARDIATLFDYILKNNSSLLSATREQAISVTSLDKITHLAMNTDIAVSAIPGLLASKTGFTDLAGGNLAIALDPELGHPIIIAVLNSTETGRFDDVLKLVSASLESVQSSVQSEK